MKPGHSHHTELPEFPWLFLLDPRTPTSGLGEGWPGDITQCGLPFRSFVGLLLSSSQEKLLLVGLSAESPQGSLRLGAGSRFPCVRLEMDIKTGRRGRREGVWGDNKAKLNNTFQASEGCGSVAGPPQDSFHDLAPSTEGESLTQRPSGWWA